MFALAAAGLITAGVLVATSQSPAPVGKDTAPAALLAHRQCRAADSCTVHSPPSVAAQGAGRSCPPGHALEQLNARYSLEWLRRSAREPKCVRVHYVPRAYDDTLADAATSICADPYKHACGRWDAAGDAPIVPVDAAAYHHQNLPALIDATLSDHESILHRFVANFCRPLRVTTTPPPDDGHDEAAWRATQSGAALPVWVPASRTPTVCGLAAADALLPDWFYAEATDLAPDRAALGAFAEALGCTQAETWLGALGNPLVAQIQWTATPRPHAELFAHPAGYQAAWQVAQALAPFAWLAVGTNDTALLRLALPGERTDMLDQPHCERIASVVFTEALEDRYAAMIKRQDPGPVLTGLNRCERLHGKAAVRVDERPPQAKAIAWACVQDAEPDSWFSLAIAYARCHAGHRIQPSAPLSDVFVPAIRVDGEAVTVTPALLQPPWFSPDMALPSVAARLYWTILRRIADDHVPGPADCDTVQRRDEWVLDTVQQCFRSLVDELFWKELLQLHCGDASCRDERRWDRAIGTNKVFRRSHRCAPQ